MAAIPGHPVTGRARTAVRLALGAAVGGVTIGLWALGGCGARAGETQWARVTARTCDSTLARAGLATDPVNSVDPARFLAERRRLLGARVGFNTVTPFRTVCTEIREELSPPSATGPTSTRPAP
ncbi:MAG: hypothetical protein RL219_1900 [Actinomycetota bacterium]